MEMELPDKVFFLMIGLGLVFATIGFLLAKRERMLTFLLSVAVALIMIYVYLVYQA